MLVEPDIIIRHHLAEYLRECGFMVLQASDTNEARQFFTQERSKINVVLADVKAPDEGGFALARWIRSGYPGTDVILSGSVRTAAEKAADLCGERPDVTKPYNHQLVLDRIRRLLAAR